MLHCVLKSSKLYFQLHILLMFPMMMNISHFSSIELVQFLLTNFASRWTPNTIYNSIGINGCELKMTFAIVIILVLGKGQNYEKQNVKNQKELRKLRRRSERRNGLFS